MPLDYLTLTVIAANQPNRAVQHVHPGDEPGKVEHAQCCIRMDAVWTESDNLLIRSDVQLFEGDPASAMCDVCKNERGPLETLDAP